MVFSSIKRLIIALLAATNPMIARRSIDSNIENGNFAFTKPYLLSVTYARSAKDHALYALAITAKNQIKDGYGLDISTALSVNCKTGTYTAAFGFDVEKPIETARNIAGSFCLIHQKKFSHALW
ncbi:hypothetical protein N9N71_00825 [Synechococcus sp. AH-229-G18]|nr:hypothetical protein [Synechococcus sp. AH-229-G18]